MFSSKFKSNKKQQMSSYALDETLWVVTGHEGLRHDSNNACCGESVFSTAGP